MKVSAVNMRSLFCKFCYKLLNSMRFNKEKSYCRSVLILLLMFFGQISKHYFLKVGGGGGKGGGAGGGRVATMYVHCSTDG